MADVTMREAVSENHWWDLASLTKVLVTLPAVMDLVGSGRIDLNAPLAHSWARARGTPFARVSAAQLLSHEAGFPAEIDLWRHPRSTRGQYVDELLHVEPESPPGVQARYSDIGFMALGEIVSDVGGMPLDVVAGLRSRLRFGTPPGPPVAYEQCPWRGFLIKGVVHDENAYALGGVAGHAGAFGRFDDLVDCVFALLVDRIARERTIMTCTSPWARGAGEEVFGLGWWLGRTRGIGGSRPGGDAFGASGFVGNRLWMEPSRGYAVLLVSNLIHPVRVDRGPFNGWWTAVVDYVAQVHAGRAW